mgnify:CR=1 FL=1
MEKVAFEGKVERVGSFTRTPFYARGWRTTSWGYPPAETVKVFTFRTPEGKAFTWFTTAACNAKEGEGVTVKGTVKKTEFFKGEERTVLTRCNVTVTAPATEVAA